MTDVFERVVTDGRDYLRAAAFAAAHELGVFAALAAPGSAESLAAALGVAPRRFRALLDVLVLEGALSPDARGYAAVRVPERAPPPAREGWGRLAEVIRDDQPLADAGDAEALRRFHRHLVEAGADAARALAPFLDGPLLDLGGGAGGYTAAFLDAHPGSTATLVDAAAVVALARAALARFGGRARFVEGDARSAAFGDGFGTALLANVLHLHPPDFCERLVERAAAALRPGGRVVVKDLRLDEDRRGPATGVYFALNMALFTAGGDVHPPERLARWLEGAGLADVTVSRRADAVVVSGARPVKVAGP